MSCCMKQKCYKNGIVIKSENNLSWTGKIKES